MKKKRWMVIFLLLLALGLGIRGYMFPKQIYIGFASGLSGQWSQLGIQVRNGFLQAVEDINKAGGIRGYEVIPIIMDDKNDNDNIPILLKTIKEKKVDYLVGFSVSVMIPSIMEIMEETDILIFSPTISANGLTGIDDQFFRVCNASVEETNILIETLKSSPNKEIALVYDISNKSYTEPMRDLMVKTANESDLSIVFDEAFDSRVADYDDLVSRLYDKQPSGVVILASGVDTAQIAQRLKALNVDAQMYAGAWATTHELLESGGKSVEGMRVSGLYDINSDSPQYIEFKKVMEKTYNASPSFPEIYGYETMMILSEAMTTARSFEVKKVKNALISTRVFDGLQQPIEIDEFGDAHRPYYIYEVRNGEFVGFD
ncbi:MAG: ABC transporter substrate-binding protein [Clostridia bacterium]|nr:ABC transporter substrate-binding protein [Clostridia bacterium]